MACGGCIRPRRRINPEEILLVLPELLEKIGTKSDLLGKTGGIFCLIEESSSNQIVEPTVVGQFTDDQTGQHREQCLATANQYCCIRQTEFSKILSSECEGIDPENTARAISDGDHIWSFSGLSPEQNEALMIMGAHMCGRIVHGAPQVFAARSDNRVILDHGYIWWNNRVPEENEEE